MLTHQKENKSLNFKTEKSLIFLLKSIKIKEKEELVEIYQLLLTKRVVKTNS